MISKKLIGTKPVQVNLRPDLKLKFCLSSMSMITFALLFYLTTSIYKIEQFLGRYGFLNCSEIWLFLMVRPHIILILDTDTASTLCNYRRAVQGCPILAQCPSLLSRW